MQPHRSEYPPLRWRPEKVRQIGCQLHPEAVTAAWYAADCPRRLDARSAGISLSDRLRWKLACLLRGVRVA